MVRSRATTSNTAARANSAYWERQRDNQAANSRPSITPARQTTPVPSPQQASYYTAPDSPPASYQPTAKPAETTRQANPASSQVNRRDSSAYWSQQPDTQSRRTSSYTVPPSIPRQPIPVHQPQNAFAGAGRATPRTADNSRESKFPEKKDSSDGKDVNYLKLAGAILEQGAGDVVGSITGAADWLLGDFSKELWTLGGEMIGKNLGKDPVSRLNSWVQETRKRDAEYTASLATGDRLAETLSKYGPDVVSGLVSLATVALSAPATTASAITSTGRLAPQAVSSLNTTMKKVFSSRNARLAFLEDGATPITRPGSEGLTKVKPLQSLLKMVCFLRLRQWVAWMMLGQRAVFPV